MKKEAIAAKDLRFQEKVGELRSSLADRRQTYQRKRKIRLGITVLIPLLLCAMAGYSMWQNPASRDRALPLVYSETQEISTATSSGPLDVTPPLSVQEDLPVLSHAMSAESAVDRREVASLANVLPSVPASAVARLESSRPTEPSSSGIRITRRLTCLAVEARECAGAQSVFALHQQDNPHIWMVVHSESLPYVIRHVYYHEGRKYADVPLVIKYPRMRTWSHVTLRSPAYVGSWRVEIVTEDGTVLDRVTFRVTP